MEFQNISKTSQIFDPVGPTTSSSQFQQSQQAVAGTHHCHERNWQAGREDLILRYTFDAGTPGTINYTCPNLGYGGLQDYTRHMFIVYAKPVRGHGSGWNKPLAWREFQTGRHPDGTPSVDSPCRLRDRRWRTGEIEAGLCQRFAAATAA